LQASDLCVGVDQGGLQVGVGDLPDGNTGAGRYRQPRRSSRYRSRQELPAA